MRLFVFLALFFFCTFMVRGQWLDVAYQINPGWNAIHMLVQPEPADCQSVFAGQPIEQVNTFNDVFSTVQFVIDPPTNFVPQSAMWLKWFSDTNAPVPGNLFSVRQGKSYLIKSTNETPFTLTIKGTPQIKPVEWRENRFNLVGFNVATASPPTFASFFNPSPHHAGQRIFRMTNDIWVLAASNEVMRAGEAFWIFVTNGPSSYQGPLTLGEAPRDGLVFGSTLTEQSITLQSASGGVRAFSIRLIPSAAPPANQPYRAGDTPLSWWNPSVSSLGEWRMFPTSSVDEISGSVTGAASVIHRFAVRRADFTPFTPPPGEWAHYGSVLEFTAESGVRQWIPVSATGLKLPGQPAVANPSHAGLWAGEVVILGVNQAIGYPNQTNYNASTPVPVGLGGEYQFRLLWHLDTNLQARLLPEAAIVWVDGTYTTNAQGFNTVLEPGRYVIVTPPYEVSQFSSSALDADAARGRRLTASVFGIDEPEEMDRGTNATANTFSCTVASPQGDRWNPSKHAYHRWHSEGSLDVNRTIDMEFIEVNTAEAGSPEWGDRMLGGIWRETVTGLRHQPIYAEGRFVLRKISDVGALNE